MLGNELSLSLKVTSAAAKAKKLIDENEKKLYKNKSAADKFNMSLLEEKLTHDTTFLLDLGKYVEESKKITFAEKIKNIIEEVSDIYQEVDLKPRTISNKIDLSDLQRLQESQKSGKTIQKSQELQVLSESEVQTIYKHTFKNAIDEKFSKPLFEGSLLDKYKDEVKYILEESSSFDLDDKNSEKLVKYAIFENIVYEQLMNTLIPEGVNKKIKEFQESQTEEYFNIFEKNIKTLTSELQENVHNIATLIAGKLFEEGIADVAATNAVNTANAAYNEMIEENDIVITPKTLTAESLSGISKIFI